MLPNDRVETTIVVADDEPALVELMGLVLQRLPWRVRVIAASTGDAAWRAIRQHRPAVAIVDMDMPGLSGLELVRLIRGASGLAHTRVIVVTGHADAGGAAAGAGADRLVCKPFSPNELLGAVRDVLGEPAA